MTDINPPNSPATVAAVLGTTLPQPPSTPPPAAASGIVPAGTTLPAGTAQAVSSAFSPSSVVKTVEADASKLEAEVSFVKANWGKLSIAVVALAAIVFLLARCV